MKLGKLVLSLALALGITAAWAEEKREKVIVPSVVGLRKPEAESRITAKGLKAAFKTDARNAGAAVCKSKPETVLNQSPKAGEQVMPNATVTVNMCP